MDNKMKKIFAALLFCQSLCIFGGEDLVVTDLSSPKNYFKEQFEYQAHDPRIVYDNNLGDVRTSFLLPKIYSPRTSDNFPLSFMYSAQNNSQVGFGRGINLGLPRIIRTFKNPRVLWLYDSGQNINELVQVQNTLVEKEISHFAKFDLSDKEMIGSFPSGEKLIFSYPEGRILRKINEFGVKVAEFIWDGSYLSEVKVPFGSLKFIYEVTSNFGHLSYRDRLPFWIDGQEYLPAKRLSKITYQSGADIKNLLFAYDKNFNLIHVSWEKSEFFHLFRASYGKFNFSQAEAQKSSRWDGSRIIGTPSSKALSLKIAKDKFIFITPEEFHKEFGMMSREAMSFYATLPAAESFVGDFNNDGISDIIRYSVPHKAGSFIDKKLGRDVTTPPSWGQPKIEMLLGVIDPQRPDFPRFVPSNDFIFPEQIELASPKQVVFKDSSSGKEYSLDQVCSGDGATVNCRRDKYAEYLNFHSQLFVADFDRDQYSDILVCGARTRLWLNRKGKFTEVPINFQCSKDALLMSVNGDSMIDIFDKDKVILLSQNIDGSISGQEIQDANYREEAKKFQENLGKEKTLVFDLNEDGFPEVFEEKDLHYFIDIGEDGNIDFLKTGDKSIYSYFPKRDFFLLESVYSGEGGGTHFEYSFNFSMPMVKKIERKNGQEVEREEVEHFNSIIDPLTHLFLGVEVVKRSFYGNNQVAGREEYISFYRDNDIRNLVNRSSLHGIWATRYVCGLGQCPKLIYQVTEGITPESHWDKYEFNEYAVINDDLIAKDIGAHFNYLMRTTKSRVEKRDDKMIVTSPYVEQWSYLKASDSGFMRKIHTQSENGIFLSVVGYDLPQNEMIGTIKTTTDFVNYQGMILVSERNIQVANKSGMENLSIERFMYEGVPLKGDFKITQQVFDKNENSDKSEIMTVNKTKRYDQEGKIIAGHDKILGQNLSYQYSKEQRRVTEKKVDEESEQEIIVHTVYDIVGKERQITTETDDESVTEKLIWNNDESLLTFIANDQKWQFSYRKDAENFKRSILYSREGFEEKRKTIEVYDLFGTKKGDQTYFVNEEGKVDFFQSPWSQYSLRNNLVSEYSSLFIKDFDSTSENMQKVVLLNKRTYDFDNRILSEIDIVREDQKQFNYYGNKVDVFINDTFDYFLRNSSKGKVELYRNAEDEKTFISEASDGKVLEVSKDYNFNYTYLANGEVGNTYYSNLDEKIFKTPLFDRVNFGNMISRFKGKELWNYGGHGQLNSVMFDKKETVLLEYDSFQRLNDITFDVGGKYRKKLTYDQNSFLLSLESEYMGNTIKQNFSPTFDLKAAVQKIGINNKKNYEITYSYDGDFVSSLLPFVKGFSYDTQGNLAAVEYSSGVKISYQFRTNGELKKITAPHFNYEIDYNKRGQIITEKENGKNKTVNYSKSHKYAVKAPLKGQMKRDSQLRLIDPRLTYYENYPTPLTIEGKKVHAIHSFKIKAVGNESYLEDDLHFIAGYFIKYFFHGTRLLGALVMKAAEEGKGNEKGTFYPIATDARMSVRAIYDNDGHLLVERSYTAWGELANTKQSEERSALAKLIDRLIRYDFAALIRPYQSSFLISKSRVYSPEYGEWLTVDPLLLQAPEKFIKKSFEEMDGFSYAGNDPINYIDPSGLFTLYAGIGGDAGAGTGVRGSSGSWFNWDTSKSHNPFSSGNYGTFEIGGHYGMSWGVGGEAGFVLGKRSDFAGWGVVSGGGGGFLGKVSLDFTFTETKTWGATFGFEFGAGGAGYQRVSHTWISEYSSDSFLGRATNFANDFYNNHFGSSDGWIDSHVNDFSMGVDYNLKTDATMD
jgi:RHS repeat-associated protein